MNGKQSICVWLGIAAFLWFAYGALQEAWTYPGILTEYFRGTLIIMAVTIALIYILRDKKKHK